MRNGMKGKKKAANDTLESAFSQGQLESLIIYACRYVLGRSTYAPHEFITMIKPHLEKLTDGTLACLDRDIQRLGDMFGFGMDIDKNAWTDFHRKIVLEYTRRKNGEHHSANATN